MAAVRCPICSTELSDTEVLCPTCGWDNSPLPEALVGTGSDRATIALLRARDQVRTTWAREFWQRLNLDAKLNHIEGQLKRARQERSHLYLELTQLQESQKLLLQTLSPEWLETLQQLQGQLQQQIQALKQGAGPQRSPQKGSPQTGSPQAGSPAQSHPIGSGSDPLPFDLGPLDTAALQDKGNPSSAVNPDPTLASPDRNENPFHLPEHRPSAPMPPAHGLPTEEEVTILQFVMPSPGPTPAPVDRYGRLSQLLEAQKWLEADRETTRIMLKVVGREGASWLRVEDIEQFPKGDLTEIDRLWTIHSNNHFGFRIQYDIWLEVTSQTASPVEAWCRFGDRLGWTSQKSRNFSLSAPAGHLPYCSAVGVWWCSGLFPQVVNAALGSA